MYTIKAEKTYNNYYICKECHELLEYGQIHTVRDCKKLSMRGFIKKEIIKGTRKWTSIFAATLLFLNLVGIIYFLLKFSHYVVGQNTELTGQLHNSNNVIDVLTDAWKAYRSKEK